MLKPFIILALPRTGTKMFVDALASHPDISSVTHEFKGSEDDYWEHPYVLANRWQDWMLDDKIVRIHLYREDAVAGAMSMLLMPYMFPQRSFDLPVNEVIDLAQFRKDHDAHLGQSVSLSVSYESLCDGKQIDRLPVRFTTKFCELVGIEYHHLMTTVTKTIKLIPRNEGELSWLNA